MDAITGELGNCLQELARHTRALQAENEKLRAELEPLKKGSQQAAGLSPRANGAQVVKKVQVASKEDVVKSAAPNNAWVLEEMEDGSPHAGLPGMVSDEDSEDGYNGGEKSGLTRGKTLASERLGVVTTCGQLDEDDFNLSDIKSKLQSASKDRLFLFQVFSLTMIVANTILTGIRTDVHVKNTFRLVEDKAMQSEHSWDMVDIAFTVWFFCELVIRATLEKWDFLFGADRAWNALDSLLVFFGVLNNALQAAGSGESANLSFLRILRAGRIVRIVQLVRKVPAFKQLRTMIFAIMQSFTNLLWALLMIMLTVYTFSIVFGMGVAAYFEHVDIEDFEQVAKAMELEAHFGSLYDTMVSLLASITGGNDWMFYGELLRELQFGEFYFVIFVFHITFCTVGLLNVVTGIFVDSAVMTRTQDELVQSFKEDLQQTTDEATRIFKMAMGTESRGMSMEVLQRHLNHPWVRAYFSGLEVDPNEAHIIFTLMDTDGSGELSIEEFVSGTLKMKGHAKGIDMLSLMFDHQLFEIHFDKLCKFVETELSEIKRRLDPSASERRIKDVHIPSKKIARIAEAPRKSKAIPYGKSLTAQRVLPM